MEKDEVIFSTEKRNNGLEGGSEITRSSKPGLTMEARCRDFLIILGLDNRGHGRRQKQSCGQKEGSRFRHVRDWNPPVIVVEFLRTRLDHCPMNISKYFLYTESNYRTDIIAKSLEIINNLTSANAQSIEVSSIDWFEYVCLAPTSNERRCASSHKRIRPQHFNTF